MLESGSAYYHEAASNATVALTDSSFLGGTVRVGQLGIATGKLTVHFKAKLMDTVLLDTRVIVSTAMEYLQPMSQGECTVYIRSRGPPAGLS